MSVGIKASDKNLLQVYIESLEAADAYAAASVFTELDQLSNQV